MAHIIVWMEADHAQIVTMGADGVEKTTLKRKEINHHTFNKKDHHGDPATNHYFKELADLVSKGEELLFVGPGLAKTHFKKFLESNHPHIFGLVVGWLDSDHVSENQLLELGRKYFKTYDRFNKPIRAGG